MTTAIAAHPNTHHSSSALAPARHPSPRHHYALAPSTSSASPSSAAPEPASKRPRSNASPTHGARSNSNERTIASGRPSPNSYRSTLPPMIKVKKEPGSPNMQSARPRPKKLDLSSSTPGARGPQTARPSAPLTARDSAGLAIQDVGLACLSPGFQTHDPAMREQLQRSLDVRDQQRQIIEARQKGVKPSSSVENTEGGAKTQDTTLFGVQTRTPTTSRRKGPPPGLSINAPSAEQFQHDRVIQSAPLHQTFTGLRPGDPHTRFAQHGPSGLSQTSHIHHVPATQTNNRLPPIADVFANDRLDGPSRCYPVNDSPGRTSHAAGPPPVPSPGFPPQNAQQHPASAAPASSRAREFRSADEAVQSLTHGRDDLKPKVVHYGGVQPPTPPSPMTHGGSGASIRHTYAAPGAHRDFHPPPATARPDLGRTTSTSGRRRGRDEYERDNGSPPSAFNRPEPKRAALAVRGDDGGSDSREDDWRQNMSGAEKREEFLRLCERAWDLFHS